jgi:hypothetical protein
MTILEVQLFFGIHTFFARCSGLPLHLHRDHRLSSYHHIRLPTQHKIHPSSKVLNAQAVLLFRSGQCLRGQDIKEFPLIVYLQILHHLI